jgi:hypothetical protein
MHMLFNLLHVTGAISWYLVSVVGLINHRHMMNACVKRSLLWNLFSFYKEKCHNGEPHSHANHVLPVSHILSSLKHPPISY